MKNGQMLSYIGEENLTSKLSYNQKCDDIVISEKNCLWSYAI